MTELDIWRSANILLKRYKDEAVFIAQQAYIERWPTTAKLKPAIDAFQKRWSPALDRSRTYRDAPAERRPNSRSAGSRA